MQQKGEQCVKCGSYAEEIIEGKVECANCGNPKNGSIQKPSTSQVAARIIKEQMTRKRKY